MTGDVRLGVSTAAFFPRALDEIFTILRQQPWDYIELMPQAPAECRPAFADDLLHRAGDRFQFCAIHFPNILQPFLYNPYPAARHFARMLCQDLADLASVLKCSVIVVHAPWERMARGRFLEVTQENLAYLCDCSARHKVWVALENLASSPLADTAAALQTFAATIDRSNLSYALDTTHAHKTGQDPVADFVDQLPELIHIHASDFDPTGGQHRCPGDGVVNWPALARALHRIGFTGNITVELLPETLGPDPVATFRRSAALLTPLLI